MEVSFVIVKRNGERAEEGNAWIPGFLEHVRNTKIEANADPVF